ncbi:MAG TPA: hypothetical protein VGM90_24965 [Kofleriaceae bacterium]|jgi:tetratricopeptide (TPR) repeat protein
MATAVVRSFLFVALVGAVAQAQPSQSTVTANALFDKGRQLMTDRKYPEACKAFEQSQKADPAAGTQYNLAACYVKINKLASAWAIYRDLAGSDTNAGRKKDSASKAKALAPRLPKLLINAASPPADLALTLDGEDATALVGVETPIDLGDHVIVATAKGFADKTIDQNISAEGKTVTVDVALDKAVAETPPKGTAPPPGTTGPTHPMSSSATTRNEAIRPQSAPHLHRRTYGYVLGGVGLAAVGVGLYFGNSAKGHYSDAEDACPGHTCTGVAYANASSDYSDAKSAAGISTGLVIGGGVALAVGVVLILTGGSHDEAPPSTAWRVSPGVANSPAGLSFGGAF